MVVLHSYISVSRHHIGDDEHKTHTQRSGSKQQQQQHINTKFHSIGVFVDRTLNIQELRIVIMIWTTTTTIAVAASLQQPYGGGTHQNHHKNDSISVLLLLLQLLFNTIIIIIIIFLSTTTYSISFLTSYTHMITTTTADAFVIQPPPRPRPYISRRIDVPSSLRRAGPTPIEMTSSSTVTSTTTTPRTTTTTTTTTRVPDDDALQQLHQQRYVVIPNFISSQLQNELRNDIQTLRGKQEYFKKANIGQDSTNTYNSTVRITETCFIGKDKHRFNTVEPNQARTALYTIVDDIGTAISSFRPKDTTSSSSSFSVVTPPKPPPVRLDDTLTELLYAYYPNGGYYRTHMDAIPNSMSYLRQYSFLLYLNTCGGGDSSTDGTTVTNDHHEWNTTTDGGQLRLYLNHQTENDATTTRTTRTLDFTNDAYQQEYDTVLDVSPTNGTLVLFDSHVIPHEVLNTYRERYVIIGWFNRPPSIWDANDYTNLRSPVGAAVAGGGTTTMTHQRMSLLTVAVGMMTYGIYNLIESL